MKNILWPVFGLLILLGCKEEKVTEAVPNLNEEIHSMQLLFVNVNTLDTLLFSYDDPDGVGGGDPTITSAPLQADTDYEIFLDYYRNTDTVPFNINNELVKESNVHQVFYVADTNLRITFDYADSDINDKPVGFKAYAYTGKSSLGEFKVILLHEPDKENIEVIDGIMDDAGGSTDFWASFDLNIQ